jgi:hypothetical protein
MLETTKATMSRASAVHASGGDGQSPSGGAASSAPGPVGPSVVIALAATFDAASLSS